MAEGLNDELYVGIAYSGDVYRAYNDILDLTKFPVAREVPVLIGHDNDTRSLFGYADLIVTKDGIVAEFGRWGDNERCMEVQSLLSKGAPIGLSLGYIPEESHISNAGEIVNRRVLDEGVFVRDQYQIVELSILPVPSDGGTSITRVRGADVQIRSMAAPVTFEVRRKPMPEPVVPVAPAPPASIPPAADPAEVARVSAIAALCADNPELCKRAIADGSSVADVIERRGRIQDAKNNSDAPKFEPATRAAGHKDRKIYESALAQRYGLVTRSMKDAPEFHEARARWRGDLSLTDLVSENVGERITKSNVREVIGRLKRAEDEYHARGLNGPTTFAADILNTTTEAYMVNVFEAIPQDFLRCSTVRSPQKREYRILMMKAGGTLKPIVNSEEIPHMELIPGDDTMRLYQYAEQVTITESDLLADELGVLRDFSATFAQKAARTVNEAAWGALAASTVFTGDSTAALPLNVANLEIAVGLFSQRVDPETGNILGYGPRFLVVPPDLAVAARALLNTTMIRETVGTTEVDRVPVLPALEVIVSPWLPAGAWYLLADPAVAPCMEVAYLNGQQAPRIETRVQPEFSRYIAFGQRADIWFGAGVTSSLGGFKATYWPKTRQPAIRTPDSHSATGD